MALSATTVAPTLTLNNWVPPSNRDCLNGSDWWIWAWTRGIDAPTVIGGPAQSVSCLPSGWEPTETYAGTACPPNYTPACPDQGNGVVTCCPTLHAFTCNAEKQVSTNHADHVRCRKTYGEKNTKLVTIVDMHAHTIASTSSMTYGAGQHLHALAIMYKTPVIMGTPTVTETPVQSTDGPSTATDSPSSGSGTSSGITTGIGIGVGVGVAVALAIAAAVFWMFWRRKKRTEQGDDGNDTKKTTTMTGGPAGAAAPAFEEQGRREINDETKVQMAMSVSPFEGATPTPTPPPGGPHPVVPGRHEMDVPHGQTELPAWSGRLS